MDILEDGESSYSAKQWVSCCNMLVYDIHNNIYIENA